MGHFTAPSVVAAHLPPQLPFRLPLVYATGALEIVLAAALLAAPSRHRPALGIITAAYLVAVFPGNVYAAFAGGVYPSPWMGWARLPFQPLFIAWVLWATRRDPR